MRMRIPVTWNPKSADCIVCPSGRGEAESHQSLWSPGQCVSLRCGKSRETRARDSGSNSELEGFNASINPLEVYGGDRELKKLWSSPTIPRRGGGAG